jgi:hypothetical protein
VDWLGYWNSETQSESSRSIPEHPAWRNRPVNWGQRGGDVQYTRTEEPFAYWTIVAVTIAMCILGLALTFELSIKDDDESVAPRKRE